MLTIIGVMVFIWIFLAYIVERAVEATVTVIPFLDKKVIWGWPVNLLLALVYSMVLAFGANLNFFAMFGVEYKWAVIGTVLAGLFMAGGAKFAHSIFKWYSENKGIVDEKPPEAPAT
jgi:flagellar biosynthesis protein FliR